MEPQNVDRLAKVLWNYGLMHQQLEKADAIIVFGSYNPAIALRAVELFQAGYSPVVVFSGNRSDSTEGWRKTEAETMADLAMQHGLPKEVIRIEPKAKNSGENARFSRQLLKEEGINTKRIIVVQKPYAERRAYATVRAQWPEVDVMVTSPQVSYEEYMNESPKDKDGTIATIVGDVQRIQIYGENGFQIPQEIPDDVWHAYKELVKLGYTRWLI